MAITTYSELKTAVENWLDHSLFTARVPEFIALFEACANRRLRVRQQETSTNLTPSNGSVALPADYLSWRRVTWTGSTRVELEYVHPSYLQAAYPTSPAGVPHFFTVEGSTLNNDERAPLLKARRDEIFDELDKLNHKTRGGAPGAVRVMGVTP
jgi:hypothetical protein